MANPRKFSEKIALLQQKEAEGTAQFEAIIQDVSSAIRDPRYQKQQNITPNLGTYRGGSLPNVNQISANQGIDLQATLQHLDDMKQGRPALSHGRQDRHRPQIGPHRRNFPPDKRIDSSPYGSAYHLSPPPDTSWRSCGLLPKTHAYLYSGVSLSRVHSDPSIHLNAMGQGNANKNYSQAPVTPPPHKRIVEMVGENAGDNNLQINYWDSKKMSPSRPKSCEVPNINIYPSQEHQGGITSTSPVIPMTTNNTGSLPDLSVLQFPPPLSTPLDQEDPYNNAAAVAAAAGTSSLSPTSPRHMPMGLQSPSSPGQHRRQNAGVPIPSPLVLNHSGAGPSSPAGMANMDPCMPQDYLVLQQQQLHQHQQQMQHPMRHRGAHSPHSQPYPTPGSPMYSPTHHRSRQTTKPSLGSPHHLHHSPSGSPTHNPSLHKSQMSPPSIPSPPVPQVRVVNCDEPRIQQQISMTQYRNNGVAESNCQSPTSPHSASSYSPAQSPGVPSTTQAANPTFSDSYYLQQQQQANALQHQFEQFNMDTTLPANSHSMSSQVLTSNGLGVNSSNGTSHSIMAFPQQHHGLGLQYSQAAALAMTSSEEMFQQPHFLGPIDVLASGQIHNQPSASSPTSSKQFNQLNSNNSPTCGSKIPDIVLTGADDICRILGNAINMPDNIDMPDIFDDPDEYFKDGLVPLDSAAMQMLSDSNLVADPATEEMIKRDLL